MSKKKLSLENLKVNSFVTSIASVDSQTIKGGISTTDRANGCYEPLEVGDNTDVTQG